MIRIAVFCVSFESDKEKDQFLSSIEQAKKIAMELVSVDVFVACNTRNNNPGYFGAVRLLMNQVDLGTYDYVIISNVDLVIEEDFFIKLANYQCEKDIGWIAPQIWSEKEKRDKNPRQTVRYSLRKLKLLRLGYQYPWLDTLYTKTLYKRKKMDKKRPGLVYSFRAWFFHHTDKIVYSPLWQGELSRFPVLRGNLSGRTVLAGWTKGCLCSGNKGH